MNAAAPVLTCTCKECRTKFQTKRTDKYFCTDKCRKDWNNRRMVRGMQLYDIAMDLRGRRVKGAFTKLCQLIDGWLREDKEAGRRSY